MLHGLFGLSGLSGCVVAIPPPIDPGGLPACSPGNYGVLGRDRCASDAECRACDLGGSCIAASITTASASCTPGDCWIACCEGRCTVLSSQGGLE